MSPTLRKRQQQAAKTARAPRADASIGELLTHINREVAKLADAQIARLWPVMQQATASLMEKLKDLDRLRPDPGPVTSRLGHKWRLGLLRDSYTAQRLRAALLQTQKAMRAMVPRLASELSAGGTVMQRAALDHMRAVVAAASKRYGMPAQLDLDMADFLMDGRRMMIPQFRASAERYAGDAFRDIRRELAIAKVEGLSWSETARQVGRRVEALGVGYRAERLVRTEMVNAYSERVDATAKAEGYDLKWNAASYRACAICGPKDDRVNVGKPPAHPNCRCTVVLWRREWDD